MSKKNIYQHEIDLKQISIRNAIKTDFAKEIINLPYRGYEVEQCHDGRKIVVTKPGGKSIYGKPKKEDILVFIFNPTDNTLWQISHPQILEDITAKCEENPKEGKILIELLHRTLEGKEPNDFISEILALSFTNGEKPETLIKAYKWIWGQEDVNYPDGDGRYMSWRPYKKLYEKLNDLSLSK